MNEMYNNLIADSFLAALIFPFTNEFYLPMMLTLGEYDALTLFMLSTLASLTGFSLNWLLGRIVMREPYISAHLREGYENICRFTKKYLSWTMVFCYIDTYGTFLPVFAGMLRVPYKYVLLFCLIGKSAYYYYAYSTGNFTITQ